ncbi:hypothetical protein Y032_0646g1089 [Ancylostoma ceylanicum]|nr:hypothetical protein Y032_0646g1089 [Ancylostoma ceylanicum]
MTELTTTSSFMPHVREKDEESRFGNAIIVQDRLQKLPKPLHSSSSVAAASKHELRPVLVRVSFFFSHIVLPWHFMKRKRSSEELGETLFRQPHRLSTRHRTTRAGGERSDGHYRALALFECLSGCVRLTRVRLHDEE